MKQGLIGAHLTQDELLDRMYGLGENGLAHLRECEECSSRLQALERRRAEMAAMTPSVSNEFLMAQRRAVYSRLDETALGRARWAPAALAVAFLLVMGVFLARPHPAYRPMHAPDPAPGVELNSEQGGPQTAQEQLFSDLYSMEQSVEPRAAAPIHGLFEASEVEAEQ
jgi:hypothetical protein